MFFCLRTIKESHLQSRSPYLPLLATWATLWSCPGLDQRITISFSTRLRSSLGRCTPARNDLRIAAFLLDAPESLLKEVLCHEAAHIAVYELYGRSAKAHGTEWRELMQLAGFKPRVRIPDNELDSIPKLCSPFAYPLGA